MRSLVLLVSAGLVMGSVADSITHGGSTVNMDFVDIGYEGATASWAVPHGSGVGYEYRIGKTEVSYAQYTASGLSGGDQWVSSLGSEAPVANISWNDAALYCNWLTSGSTDVGAYAVSGGVVTGVTAHDGAAMDTLVSSHGQVYVLPTADEWYKAAYYNAGRDDFTQWSTGDSANSTSTFNYNNVNAEPWTVGGSALEQNGTQDMIGNVYEWTETADGANQYAFGGSYKETTGYMGAINGNYSWTTDAKQDFGFRVVAIPEPGTISLMSLSTFGILLTRRVRRRKSLGASVMPVRRERACDVFDLDYEAPGAETIEEAGLLAELIQARAQAVWSSVHAVYERMDTNFWNYMVVQHERRVAKRVAFRQAFKTKSLHVLDAILAAFMK